MRDLFSIVLCQSQGLSVASGLVRSIVGPGGGSQWVGQQVGLDLLQHGARLCGVKVFMAALFHAVLLQLVVPVGGDAVARQAPLHAVERATVVREGWVVKAENWKEH